jgi:hypothetical protein
MRVAVTTMDCNSVSSPGLAMDAQNGINSATQLAATQVAADRMFKAVPQ